MDPTAPIGAELPVPRRLAIAMSVAALLLSLALMATVVASALSPAMQTLLAAPKLDSAAGWFNMAGAFGVSAAGVWLSIRAICRQAKPKRERAHIDA